MNRFLRRSVFLAAGVAVAFGLVEVAARFVLGLGTPPLFVEDPDIEYMFRPDQDVMRFGNRQLYNAYSMRAEDFPLVKPAGEFRILCFGDSVLNGGSLTDHANLATTLLQGELNAQWNRPVVVGNVSAGSWGTPNLLAYARRYGLFGADHVVVLLSSHDIDDVPGFSPLDPSTHPTRKPCCAAWEGITRYLPRYIPSLKSVLQPQRTSVRETPARQIRDNEEEVLQALSGLLDMARAEGAAFLLVLHAERGEVVSGVFKEGHGRFVEWARLHSVDMVDLGPVEAENLERGVDPYCRNSAIHIGDAGQRILADKLFQYFTDRDDSNGNSQDPGID